MPYGAGLFERTVNELMKSKKDYLKSECFRIGLDSMGTKKQLSDRIAEYEKGVLEKVRLEAVKDLPPPPQLSETYIARRTKLAKITEEAVKEDIEFSGKVTACHRALIRNPRFQLNVGWSKWSQLNRLGASPDERDAYKKIMDTLVAHREARKRGESPPEGIFCTPSEQDIPVWAEGFMSQFRNTRKVC